MPQPQIATDDDDEEATADVAAPDAGGNDPIESEIDEAFADPFDGEEEIGVEPTEPEPTNTGAADAPAVETEPDDDGSVKEEMAEPVFAEGGPGADFFDGADDAPGIHPEGADDAPAGGPAPAGPGTQPGLPQGPEDGEEPEVSFEDTINSGFARLSVVGLDENEGKDDLRGEFKEVFEEFKLGHYGNELAQEYMLDGEEDIHPVWGFCGALTMCLALVVYMRPDGDEILDDFSEKLSGLGDRFK